VVMEVSSHAIALERVSGTEFAVAMFTNLGVDHLDFHEDLEDYEATKAALFELGRCRTAIVSTDTPAGERIAVKGEVPTVVVPPAVAHEIEATPHGCRFRWRDITVTIPLAGTFNVTNAVLAAEAAVALGFTPDAVAAALATIAGVPGRFETIDEGQEFSVIVDYAHTPDGLEAVLEAARAFTENQLIVVFGAGGDRDKDKRPQMGEAARRLADRVIVTSDNPRSEAPDDIAAGIVAGMATAPDLVELDRQTAIHAAVSQASRGDVVVVAGKGHETSQTIAHTVLEFDDRVVVREALRRRGGLAE